MKEKGIWLLDASIVGLYRSGIKNYKKIVKRIIEICWKNHLLDIVNEQCLNLKPEETAKNNWRDIKNTKECAHNMRNKQDKSPLKQFHAQHMLF